MPEGWEWVCTVVKKKERKFITNAGFSCVSHNAPAAAPAAPAAYAYLKAETLAAGAVEMPRVACRNTGAANRRTRLNILVQKKWPRIKHSLLRNFNQFQN